MTHILLRIAVWVAVLGIGYLVFGPQLFDSSRHANPFGSDSKLFLPPAKPQRLIEYETALNERALKPAELAQYQALVQERQANFWKRDGITVEEALSGVKSQRRAHLAAVLAQRGLSQEELAVFFMVLDRDHPTLLADRE